VLTNAVMSSPAGSAAGAGSAAAAAMAVAALLESPASACGPVVLQRRAHDEWPRSGRKSGAHGRFRTSGHSQGTPHTRAHTHHCSHEWRGAPRPWGGPGPGSDSPLPAVLCASRSLASGWGHRTSGRHGISWQRLSERGGIALAASGEPARRLRRTAEHIKLQAMPRPNRFARRSCGTSSSSSRRSASSTRASSQRCSGTWRPQGEVVTDDSSRRQCRSPRRSSRCPTASHRRLGDAMFSIDDVRSILEDAKDGAGVSAASRPRSGRACPPILWPTRSGLFPDRRRHRCASSRSTQIWRGWFLSRSLRAPSRRAST